jgi:hypothetical protein
MSLGRRTELLARCISIGAFSTRLLAHGSVAVWKVRREQKIHFKD